MFNLEESEESNNLDMQEFHCEKSPNWHPVDDFLNLSVGEFRDQFEFQAPKLIAPQPTSSAIQNSCEVVGFYCPSSRMFVECTQQEFNLLKKLRQNRLKHPPKASSPGFSGAFGADVVDSGWPPSLETLAHCLDPEACTNTMEKIAGRF